VVDKWVSPVRIAEKNEKLYQEWDDKTGISRLVWTVLIGDISIPMVSDNGAYFPSMYPYVDFVDKQFVYNTRSNTYEVPPSATRNAVEAEIWHGVINPAVGRDWTDDDITKIAGFLDKTHLFYSKSGRFAPSTIPPRVFYYDGEYESQSVNFRSLFQYALSMQNSENLAYKRFTKYLLGDLNRTLIQFDAKKDQESNDFMKSLGVPSLGNGLSDEAVATMQDINSRTPIQAMLKDFKSIINSKTLSDWFANVHNAWRYNNQTNIRADFSPLQMTVMDEIARTTLKEANVAIMESIDSQIGKIAKRIPIFDTKTTTTHNNSVYNDTWVTLTLPYQNYFLGQKSSNITKPEQCTIARGSNVVKNQFWKDVLVEANAAYDINSTELHINTLANDTEELVNLHKNTLYSCFSPSTNLPKLTSYWGSNSLLRIMSSSDKWKIMQEAPSWAIQWFSEDIFSLGGMKETTRLTVSSIADCMTPKYQYLLKMPYIYEYTIDDEYTHTCRAWYPKEWNTNGGMCPEVIGNRTPRFSCVTEQDVSATPTFDSTVANYTNKSTCYNGTVTRDGTIVAQSNRTCKEFIGAWDDITEIDKTIYESVSFHTIPSLLRHVSPTEAEVAAAENNWATPSLPVDMVRYLEYLDPSWTISRINYPNFFNAPDTDRDGLRTWVNGLSNGKWSSTISDDTLDMILRARNWLNPDVTKKYQEAIETTLSYSHEYPWIPSHKQPPKYPVKTNWYEIAYLGLAPFIPSSTEVDPEIANIQQDYTVWLAAIQWLNISEPYEANDNPYDNSDKCWPPEGVDIFQWPAAILCWIGTLLPPRIIAGSCGANTIGQDSNSSAPLLAPPAGYSSDDKKTQDFYDGWKLVYSAERSGMSLRDSLQVGYTYTKSGSRLILPFGSQMKLEVISLLDAQWESVSSDRWSQYFDISPSLLQTTGPGGNFLITSKEEKSTLQVQSVLKILLPGWTFFEKKSDPFTVRINSEYLQIVPQNNSWSVTSIDVTEPSKVTLYTSVVDGSWTISESQYPMKLTVIDDVSETVVQSGIVIPSPAYALPDIYTKNIWVYRLLVQDSLDRIGESTLVVRSGKLSKVVLSPVSTMLRKWSNTLVIVRLQDMLGNSISPDLNQVVVEVSGWYLSDANGEKQTKMTIDAMEADIPVLLGSDNAGSIDIKVSTDSGKWTTGSIRVLDEIKTILIRSADPQVGGDTVEVSLKIVDGNENSLTWFSSVASLELPEGAWSFEPSTLPIKDWVTAPFVYTPWIRSGNHSLRIDIPGIWTMSDVNFSLLPGIPLYVSHSMTDSTITFALNDRYGNVSNANLIGTIKHNIDSEIPITFSNGLYTIPKKSWFYTIHVPELENSILTYSDANGTHNIKGIPFYATYIEGPQKKFDFLPDYNARYSVLYGDSYLREGEDILYNSDSTDSQSIAVTTLLDSPFNESNIATVLPGWKIVISNTQDDALAETSISLMDSYPVVHIQDVVSQEGIANILYKLKDAQLSVCEEDCFRSLQWPAIRLIPSAELWFSGSLEWNDSIILNNWWILFFTIDDSWKMILTPWITLHLLENQESDGILIDIQSGWSSIASLLIATDDSLAVKLSDSIGTATERNTPIVAKASSITVKKFSKESLSSQVFGYSFLVSTGFDKFLDEREVWPNWIESFAATHDTPGIGWGWNNRTLLSYAAGDTVWEATRWFHTYTLINMGDPVAHVDHMAPGTQVEWIDRTIGTQITSNLWAGVSSYAYRDMDADELDDIITLDTDGYVNLYLNMGSRFRYREQIAYLPDLSERWVSLWDFWGDSYADIIGLDHSGSLVYIDNTKRRLARMDIKIAWSTHPTGITDFKIYDMDADGKDDIVYMNEWWELAILYGTTIAGNFTKNILDSSLGVTFSTIPEIGWWAVFFDGIPQIPAWTFGVSTSSGAELDDSILESEVYYNHSEIITSDTSNPAKNADFTSLSKTVNEDLASAESSSAWSKTQTYIKSQYAWAYNLEVSRTWKNLSSSTLHGWDRILAQITLKNTGGSTLRDIRYLDKISPNFDPSDTKTYDVLLGWQKVTRDFSFIASGEYDSFFEGRDIWPWETLTFEYELRAFAVRHGELTVGKLEAGEPGDDQYGDVWFKGAISCGADMLLWRSGPWARDYVRWTHTFSQAEIPANIKSRVIDEDGNTIPDSIDEDMADLQPTNYLNNTTLSKDLKSQFNKITASSTSTSKPLVQGSLLGGSTIELGFDASAVDNIDSMMQDFKDWLACWFGWGSCMSFPINWAPLAPGAAPSIFGYPIFPLTPELGQPITSWLTWYQAMCGTVPCCLPSLYPATMQGFWAGICTLPSPGWMIWNWDPTNQFRIYLTPTLTLGMGAAMCFWGPAKGLGRIPPSPLFWFIQGGNCIVVAKPMPFCKGDGSDADGDVTWVSGLGQITEAWNSESCKIQAQSSSEQKTEDRQISQSVVDYIKNPSSTKRKTLYNTLSQRPARTITAGPAIRIGWASSWGGDVGIEIDTSKPFTMGNIIKIKNGRIPSFPGFIMTWVSNQVNELINALFTAPNLVIVLPWAIGANMQFDGNWQNFEKWFTSAYSAQTFDNLKAQMWQAYSTTDVASSLKSSWSGKPGLAQDFKKWQNSQLSWSAWGAINQAAGWLASVRAAYKLLWQLPLVNIRRVTVPINVPWILPDELNKYSKTLEWYKKEIDSTLTEWCVGKTPAQCADAKASLSAWGFMGSVGQNLSRIEEYKKFPVKLQKYITWKQRYMSQVLCNVETIRIMLGWWIKDNGMRFRKWAELFVLIKAIAESWNPLIDVFKDTSNKCDKCLNQRNSTTDWKLKILSAIIPSPPIIKFPRWPDIILDLSDIRLGINISVPEFKFNVKPIRLPNLPSLSLPNSPTVGLTLPSLPLLPPIPKLPDLPDLPSLPRIALPNLPPPPKIPKLFWSVAVALKIFKLWWTIKCFLNDTYLAPEWEVGDIIARKTERQWTMSFDFLGIQFPNFTLPSVREIRVATHVNFNLRSDFITEFARSAVKPVNEFTTDIGRALPSKIGNDVNIDGPSQKINLTPGAQITSTGEYLATLQDVEDLFQSESNILLDTDEFKEHIMGQFDITNNSLAKSTLLKELKKSEIESERLTNKLLEAHNEKFDILIKYIQAEYDSTAELQNILDMITDDSLSQLAFENTFGPSQLVQWDVSNRTESLLKKYTTLNTSSIQDVQPSSSRTGVQGSLGRLSARLNTLAAVTSASSSASTWNDGLAWYAPVFDGVFVLTPSGVQTRLFDSTDLLSSDERINVADIDRDGDKDYLFRLEWALYIKYSGMTHRSDKKDATIITEQISESDILPTSPNFFHEIASSPKSLNITFTPSNLDQKEWRLSFYDSYIERDMIPLGLHDSKSVPERVIDFYTEEQNDTISENIYEVSPLLRSIEQISDKDSFLLVSPKITVLKDEAKFTLSAWRKLYTGNDPVTLLSYSGAWEIMTLLPHKSYAFKDLLTAKVTDGIAYTFNGSQSQETYSYSDDYIGMPMVSGMQMMVSNGWFKIFDHTLNRVTSFDSWTDYLLRSLWASSDSYNATISYPNGMYSAQLSVLDNDPTTVSDVILLSPQVSGDQSAPIIDIPDVIRVPVYSSKIVDLSEYVSEMNAYDIVFDEDITLDENGNGIPDDDFTKNWSGLSLVDKTLTIAAHTSLDTYESIFKVVDERGNTAFKWVQIEIYPPVPQITNISWTGWLDGSLDEEIVSEPIHLFRVRPGANIERVNSDKLLTNTDWLFLDWTYFTSSGAIISRMWWKINISENWVFGAIPAWYTIDVTPATSANPLQIQLRDQDNSLIYSQFMIIPQSTQIIDASLYKSDDTDVLVITPESSYTLVKASLDDPSIPGWAYLVDSSYKAVLAIANDGNAYAMSDKISLTYNTRESYVSLWVLLDGVSIANLWYKTSFFYTVK
jgi:hypothetical protein